MSVGCVGSGMFRRGRCMLYVCVYVGVLLCVCVCALWVCVLECCGMILCVLECCVCA